MATRLGRRSLAGLWTRRRRRRRESPGVLEDSGALDPALMARVRQIEIRTRRFAATLLSGDYRSIFKGSGIEFAEAREYLEGDDIRLIDWNVTARMGTPWVKEFVEERELTVICAVDRSASQLVAAPSTGRMGMAAELTALLGFAAVTNHDRAGLLTFSDEVETFVPPRRGTRHVLRLVQDVLEREPEVTDSPASGTSIATAADYLGRVLRRRSVVFLISDFFDTGYEQALQTLARRHEVIALPLVDPMDLELPDLGVVEMVAAESGERLLLDTSNREVRRRYAEAAAERTANRRLALATAGIDEVEIHLDEDPVSPLVLYFRRKAQQR